MKTKEISIEGTEAEVMKEVEDVKINVDEDASIEKEVKIIKKKAEQTN